MIPELPHQNQSTPRARQGFTLIELLIVITIIAILATIIFAGGNYAIKRARIAQAQNIAVGIANACTNFESEYNRMPIPDSGGTESNGTWVGDSGEPLTAVLTGLDDTINRKEIDFLDGIEQADGSPPVGGIDYLTDETRPAVIDPWESFFVVHLDSNFDKEVTNPEDPAEKLFNTRAAVLSKGEDRLVEESNDNAKSW